MKAAGVTAFLWCAVWHIRKRLPTAAYGVAGRIAGLFPRRRLPERPGHSHRKRLLSATRRIVRRGNVYRGLRSAYLPGMPKSLADTVLPPAPPSPTVVCFQPTGDSYIPPVCQSANGFFGVEIALAMAGRVNDINCHRNHPLLRCFISALIAAWNSEEVS